MTDSTQTSHSEAYGQITSSTMATRKLADIVESATNALAAYNEAFTQYKMIASQIHANPQLECERVLSTKGLKFPKPGRSAGVLSKSKRSKKPAPKKVAPAVVKPVQRRARAETEHAEPARKKAPAATSQPRKARAAAVEAAAEQQSDAE